jgi:hypothetical protein
MQLALNKMKNSPEQGTAEWFALRRGLFTGSEIENICKPKGLGATGETYIFDKVAEMLTPPEFDIHFENDATRWGKEHEPLAVHIHEKRSKSVTEEIGFQVHHAYPFLGASPDRKVFRDGKVGVMEVKCPYEAKNHVKHMMIESVEYLKAEFPKYYWQMVCEFVCTPDVEFVDFVSFDPRMSKKYRYFCFTFTPSNEDCQFLINRAIEAETKRQKIINKINR